MNKELEEFNNSLIGKSVAIIGLGVSNIPLLKYMNKRGAKVTVFDNRDAIDIPKEILDEGSRYDMKYFFGNDSLSN